MKIAMPPRPIPGGPANTQKQHQVFELVFRPDEDTIAFGMMEGVAPLALAHDAVYLRELREELTPNGFGNTDPLYLRHASESVLAVVSAMAAALSGAVDGKKVAFAPASGFHHAGHDYSGGYCTLNGLVAGLMGLKHLGLLDKATIIDGDGHYGDGTQDIIDRLGLHWINHVSLDKASVQGSHAEAQRRIAVALGGPSTDLVVYQAGADAHIRDPYKAGYLTDADWKERDNFVFRTCASLDIPVAWCLAGGYNGTKTLNLHTSTFASALQVYYPESARLLHGQASLLDMADWLGRPPSSPESSHHA